MGVGVPERVAVEVAVPPPLAEPLGDAVGCARLEADTVPAPPQTMCSGAGEGVAMGGLMVCGGEAVDESVAPPVLLLLAQGEGPVGLKDCCSLGAAEALGLPEVLARGLCLGLEEGDAESVAAPHVVGVAARAREREGDAVAQPVLRGDALAEGVEVAHRAVPEGVGVGGSEGLEL